MTPFRNAEIVASGPQTLDIVWVEEERIFYTRSTDAGATWSPKAGVLGSINIETKVNVDTDGNGQTFAVWDQRGAGSEGGTNIFYSKYDGVSWTLPIQLSNDSQEVNKSALPSVVATAEEVVVAYSYSADPLDVAAPQFAVRRQCTLATDCSNSANWGSSINVAFPVVVNSEDHFSLRQRSLMMAQFRRRLCTSTAVRWILTTTRLVPMKQFLG